MNIKGAQDLQAPQTNTTVTCLVGDTPLRSWSLVGGPVRDIEHDFEVCEQLQEDVTNGP